MTGFTEEKVMDINEVILLKLLCERSEQYLASAQAILHTKVGNSGEDNLRHVLELLTMEFKMLGGYVDYKATALEL